MHLLARKAGRPFYPGGLVPVVTGYNDIDATSLTDACFKRHLINSAFGLSTLFQQKPSLK